MESIRIEYRFNLDPQTRETITLFFDAESFEPLTEARRGLPRWTELRFHRCPHCPLNADCETHCPVAVSLVDVVERFSTVLSYDEIDLEVVTEERRVLQRTTAQAAISSLIGLLMATSGCPHTSYFKPMARFHLPMASEAETLFRAAGMYLLAQYFYSVAGCGGELDFTGLKEIYDNLHTLNVSVAGRLREASQVDSSLNAVIILDMYAKAVPYVIDETLEEIRSYYNPYFNPG